MKIDLQLKADQIEKESLDEVSQLPPHSAQYFA